MIPFIDGSPLRPADTPTGSLADPLLDTSESLVRPLHGQTDLRVTGFRHPGHDTVYRFPGLRTIAQDYLTGGYPAGRDATEDSERAWP